MLCAACRSCRHFFDQVVSPCGYDGVAKELILALKYQGELSLGPFLGRLTAEAVQQRLGNDPADSVVPVPLSPCRFRERGFNQAQALAQAVADALRLPCRSDLLFRQEATPPQTGLTRRQRLRNMARAFSLKPNPLIRSSRILLVDDVFTTGATVDSCARALKESGAARVVVATFAHG